MRESYIHQARLANAVHRLHKIGRRGESGGGSGQAGEDAAGGLMAGIGELARQKPKQDNTMKNAIASQTMDASIKRQTMQDAIQRGVGENYVRQNPPQMPEGVNWGSQNAQPDPLKAQLNNLKVAEAAKYAPIAGEYTQQGRERMIQDVENNAHDITLSKNLIGMAGSQAALPNQYGLDASKPIIGGF